MRILHCLRAPVGGLFRHVLDLAGEQARRGHEVGIIADSNAEDRLTSPKFEAIAPLLSLGIQRTAMSRRPGIGDVQAWRSVLQHARGLKLDVLHGHGAKGGAYARLAKRALARRGELVSSFYTPHGGSLNFKPGTTEARIFLGLERILERYGDGLIFESAFAARVYGERVGQPSIPHQIVPNGLQPDDFLPVTPAENARDVLFIGELRAIKGIEYLIDALAVLNRGGRVTATIVGSGASDDALKSKVEALGLSEVITFTGALPARDAFPLGRVMVVPSLAESFPYVVLEAAAAGLPLISTDVGGIPEIVAGTNTKLIAAGSVDALTQAIAHAWSSPADAKEKAATLRDNVARKFTVGGMTDSILAFYALSRR